MSTHPPPSPRHPDVGRTRRAAGPSRRNSWAEAGVGVDPEKAIQDAFSRAIEQTVGVLVDAETVVKNDQLIRDAVLTCSRGYVEKYEIVRRREDGGLHHATIRATVARDRLVQKLKEMKVAMQDVAGEMAARQFEFDAQNEEQAAELLKKALAGFDMTKLTKVDIVGEPEISRDGAKANVKVTVKLSPDIARWRGVSRDLRFVLSKAASKRGTIDSVGQNFQGPNTLANQLAGEGVLVALFAKANMNGDLSNWDLFRVPKPLEGAIKVTASGQSYRIVCALLGDNGEEIMRVTALRSGNLGSGLGCAIAQNHTDPISNCWCIGPTWWHGEYGKHGPSGPVKEATVDFVISQEDLKAVRKAVAFLERDSSPGAPAGDQYPGGMMPAGGAPAGYGPGGMMSAGGAPAGYGPGGMMPAGGAPAGYGPGGMMPAGGAPTGYHPGGSMPPGYSTSRPRAKNR